MVYNDAYNFDPLENRALGAISAVPGVPSVLLKVCTAYCTVKIEEHGIRLFRESGHSIGEKAFMN